MATFFILFFMMFVGIGAVTEVIRNKEEEYFISLGYVEPKPVVKTQPCTLYVVAENKVMDIEEYRKMDEHLEVMSLLRGTKSKRNGLLVQAHELLNVEVETIEAMLCREEKCNQFRQMAWAS